MRLKRLPGRPYYREERHELVVDVWDEPLTGNGSLRDQLDEFNPVYMMAISERGATFSESGAGWYAGLMAILPAKY